MRNKTMRAHCLRHFGPPEAVQLREVDVPVPGPREVLVQIKARTVSSADVRIRRQDFPAGFGLVSKALYGFTTPRRPTLGGDYAGLVVGRGREVVGWEIDQAVFGQIGFAMGCHAEYVCVRADSALAVVPEGLGFASAAALCFGGTTAAHYLRRASLREGERLLIHGAAGVVGSAVLQLAKVAGAHVTAIGRAETAQALRDLGADQVLAREKTPLDELAKAGERFDVVLDTSGHMSLAQAARLLRPGGRLLLVAASLPDMIQGWRLARRHGCRLVVGPAQEWKSDLEQLAALAANRSIRPLISRTLPFEHMVEAHRWKEQSGKVGSVIVSDTG